jgi:hypothetical protein
MWYFRPLDYKYRTIFKLKRNEIKLIDGWNVKIEKNWKKVNWEDPFSKRFVVVSNQLYSTFKRVVKISSTRAEKILTWLIGFDYNWSWQLGLKFSI